MKVVMFCGGYGMRMPHSIDVGIAVQALPLAETSHHWFDEQAFLGLPLLVGCSAATRAERFILEKAIVTSDRQQRHPVKYCQRKTVE